MKKDILFLCQFFYPEHNSSATLPFDTAKYLASSGYSVGALVGYPQEYNFDGEVPLEETVDEVSIKRIRYLQFKRSGKIGRLINYFSFTALAYLHIRELKQYKAVIVYSNPPILPIIPIIAKKRYGTKFVFVAYDVYPEVAYASKSLTEESLISKVMRKINTKLYDNADCVVALTDEMRQFLLSNRNGLSENRIVTIANWAHEKEYLKTDTAYDRFGYNKSQFIVSYFGNMGICQDVETMLGAAEILKNNDRVRFLIVGHGSKKELVKARIESKDLKNVQLLDFLIGEEFQQAVSISSCSIVSLERGLKGTCAPSKYYSYLQGGQPILAVTEGDSYLASEVEEYKIGYHIQIGDSEGLAAAIMSMLDCNSERELMAKNAQNLYKSRYDISIGLEKYRRLFETAIL